MLLQRALSSVSRRGSSFQLIYSRPWENFIFKYWIISFIHLLIYIHIWRRSILFLGRKGVSTEKKETKRMDRNFLPWDRLNLHYLKVSREPCLIDFKLWWLSKKRKHQKKWRNRGNCFKFRKLFYIYLVLKTHTL